MVVITQAWLVSTDPLDDLIYLANSFGQIGYDIFQQTAAEIEPFLLEELRHYPPVPPGSKYVRTFKLREGWAVRIGQVGVTQFRFDVYNRTHYSAWVVGSLAQNRAIAESFQREFHRANGWQLATDTVTFWFQAFLELYQEKFDGVLAGYGTLKTKRRARTSFL